METIENNTSINKQEEQEEEQQQEREQEREEEREEEESKEINSNISPSLSSNLTKQQSIKDRYGFILSNDSIELRRTEEQKLFLMEKELERTKKWIKMTKKWEYTVTHKGNKLRERLRKGIPDALRSDVWLKLARVNDMKQIYPNKFLLTQPSNVPEITIDEIERDINRTFPSHDFFENGQANNNGQNSLRRILQSYAAFDPETGYCQGMGFIAAMFLIYMVEEDAFYALVSLLQRPTLPLRAMYRPGMPGTKLVLNVFSHLGERYLPKIWNHLTQENIHYSMYATSWFMTVYTNSFPFDLVTKIFDVLWYEGFKIVYRVALALLKYSEEVILSNQFEGIMLYFRTLPKTVDYVKLWKIVWEIPLKSEVIEMYSNRHHDDGGANI